MGQVIPMRQENKTPDLAKLHRWANLLSQRASNYEESIRLILDMIRKEVPHVIMTDHDDDFIFFATREEDNAPVFAFSFENPSVKES